MLGRHKAEVSHELAWRSEPAHIAGDGKNGCGDGGVDAAHGAESVEDGLHRPLRRQQLDLLVMCLIRSSAVSTSLT